jgi:hypothetical protein
MKKGDARALIFFVGVITFIVWIWIVPEAELTPELTIITLGLFFGFIYLGLWYRDKSCPHCDRVGEWDLIGREDLGGWTEKKAVPKRESDGTIFYVETIYVGSKVRKTWKCRNCGYTRHTIRTHIDKY